VGTIDFWGQLALTLSLFARTVCLQGRRSSLPCASPSVLRVEQSGPAQGEPSKVCLSFVSSLLRLADPASCARPFSPPPTPTPHLSNNTLRRSPPFFSLRHHRDRQTERCTPLRSVILEPSISPSLSLRFLAAVSKSAQPSRPLANFHPHSLGSLVDQTLPFAHYSLHLSALITSDPIRSFVVPTPVALSRPIPSRP
jgi:hypothetical protein